jgi:hypothetical protein
MIHIKTQNFISTLLISIKTHSKEKQMQEKNKKNKKNSTIKIQTKMQL